MVMEFLRERFSVCCLGVYRLEIIIDLGKCYDRMYIGLKEF